MEIPELHMNPEHPGFPQTSNDNPRALWENLRSNSTLHGFQFASESTWSIRRITWIVMLLCGSISLFWQLHSNFHKWKQYEVLYSLGIERPENLPFPAVSICNQNMMRKSKIIGTDAQHYVDGLDPGMRSNLSDKHWNASFDVEQATRASGHNLSEMLKDCRFQEMPCTAEEFIPFFHFFYGLCYTFNSGRDQRPVRSVISYGSLFSLSLILDAQPEEYYGYYSREGTGFKVAVHDQKKLPFIQREVSPGFTTSISVERKEIFRLPPPYKSRCGNRLLVSSRDYSKSLCENECYARKVIAQCKCRVMGFPRADEFRVRSCSIQEVIYCVYKEYESFWPGECDCPIQCKDVEYSTALSTLYFPSEPFSESFLKNYAPTKSEAELEYIKKKSRESLVYVKIFYETPVKTVLKERAAYTFQDAIGDVGGNMGLFLGCSLLTLFEFVEFPILVCLAWWRRRRKPAPTNTES